MRHFTSPNGSTIKNFGISVSASAASNTLAVGALNSGSSGLVFVYSMSPTDRTVITYQANLSAHSPSVNDRFGWSVALGTDAVFIGSDYGSYSIYRLSKI